MKDTPSGSALIEATTSPGVRRFTRTPTRDSTCISPPERTDAATPAGWSPGTASAGAATSKGTTSVSPGATTTSSGTVIHAPPSAGGTDDGRMSKLPRSVR